MWKMGILDGLLGDETVEPPEDETEKRRLEHERRKLKRKVKRLEKRLDDTHCATCAQSPVDQERLAMSRQLKDLRDRLDHVERRLDAAS